ncbi:uncharacterized protein [Argopecten irradians]|uniref:uncharacterized protein isoform X2 n=1 Tax=Argopecten irradians TaxID=31199 RepID=UPI0037202EAA
MLEHGANPNSAVIAAVCSGNVDIVKVTLEHGANPNKALECAVKWDKIDIVKLSLQHGAYQNEALEDAVIIEKLDIIKLLLQQGADPNQVLIRAVTTGNVNIVKVLLEHGANPDWSNALKIAALKGHLDIVRILIESGADVNKDNALQHAVKRGHQDIVRFLIESGAEVNNDNALQHAVKRGHQDIVRFLIESGAEVNNGDVLEEAVKEGNMDVVSLIIERGADIHKSNALETAARTGRTDIVSLLLDKGANLDQLKTEDGEMPVFNTDVNAIIARRQEQIRQEQEYAEGIKKTVEKPCNITITVVGHKGVGKSCLVKQLKKESIPQGGPGSTDTADFYVNYIAYNPDTGLRKILDKHGEMETGRHQLRHIIYRYQKGEVTEDKALESDQFTINMTDTHNTKLKAGDREQGNEPDQGRTEEEGVSSSEASAVHAPSLKRAKTKGLEKKKDVDVSREQKDVIEEIMHTEISENDERVKGFITIYDFGGEEVFYNTVHSYLSSNMVFVVVFDVQMCTDPERSAAGYEITEQWLKNIATYAIDISAVDVRTPPVILVGSHLDQVSSDKEEQDATFAHVLQTLYKNPTLQEIMVNHVQDAFPIANLDDSTINQDMYEVMWQKVLDISHLQSRWKKPVAARWTALQHELVRLKHQGVIVLTHGELLDVNRNLPVPLKEDEIKDFLQYLKLNGSFHCYNVHGDSPFAILQAQWTIDAFKKVITDPKFTANLPKILRPQWVQYEKSGILPVRLLMQLWNEERFLEHKEILCIVMETLNLLAKPLSDDPNDDIGYYIVPCMLKTANPEVLQPLLEDPNTVTTVTLCLKFNNPFIPQAVWDKLIASCIHRFERLNEQGHDNLRFVQRGFVCLAVNGLWNMAINCRDRAMKAIMFTKDAQAKPKGAGISLFCILENLLQRILDQNQQSHLKYQLYLHNDYRFTSNDKMVKIDELKGFERLECIGPNGFGWIKRDDIYTWFEDPSHEDNQTARLSEEMTHMLPERKLSCKEIGRVSKYIGSGYQTFFVGLGFPSELLQQEMEEHRHLAFRSRITKVFLQLSNMKVDSKFRAVAAEMLQNGMDPGKLIGILDCKEDCVFKDERLPETWLQEILTVNDVPVIARYIGVKAYFNMFLELGLQPQVMDLVDVKYRNKPADMLKALLETFITETQPPPTRSKILLAMQECNMDTESLIAAFIATKGKSQDRQ